MPKRRRRRARRPAPPVAIVALDPLPVTRREPPRPVPLFMAIGRDGITPGRVRWAASRSSGEKGRQLMDKEQKKKPTPAEPTPLEGEEPEPKAEPKPDGDLDS